MTNPSDTIAHAAKTKPLNGSEHALVEELPTDLLPFEALQKVVHLPYPVFLDSSLKHETLGTVSYVAADPFDFELCQSPGWEQLIRMDELQARFQTQAIEGLPPFQGGLINLCSYELNSCFENIQSTINEFEIPGLFYGLYDTVLIFDHQSGQNWIVSQGFPETESAKRRARAAARIRQFKECLNSQSQAGLTKDYGASDSRKLDASQITGLEPTSISHQIFSNFTREQYIAAVQRCIDYIYAGDIFQVNLSQRLLSEQTIPSLAIYDKLRQKNEATFAAYLDLGSVQILSSSPERLLNVQTDGLVETRPIKGTRQRSCYPEANLFSAEGLIASEKDRAENVMIVDLLRNDISKICADDSIHVSTLCGIENYEFVQHLVSVIRGRLKPSIPLSKIFESIFPGGSITGAPKVRAMEIIAEVERVARGAYCGSLGYASFNGAIDQNILIRTITAAKGWLQIPVGGGIVSQSDPVSEYEETVHKAHGMLRALF